MSKLTIVYVQMGENPPESFEIRDKWASPEEVSSLTSEYVYGSIDHKAHPNMAGNGSVFMVGVRAITEETGEISIFNESQTLGTGMYQYVDDQRAKVLDA
jgi:hypothetical protein